MAVRKLAAAVGLAMALALPALPAMASHGGDIAFNGGRHHGQGHDGGALNGGQGVWTWKDRHERHLKHHGLLQFEGVVSSFDGSTLVLHPLHTDAVTVTIAISSSTVVTADESVTTTTLAAGEQVHVKAAVGAGGSFTAVRVTIQRSETGADQTPTGDDAAQPTAEPTTTPPDQEAGPNGPHGHHKHKGHGDDSSAPHA
jgi:hypothetical protein